MKVFLRSILIGFLIGLLLILIQLIINYINLGRLDNYSTILKLAKYQMLYAIVLCVVNTYWFNYINGDLKWREYRKYRFLISFSGSIIITLISIFFIRMYHEMVWEQETFREFLSGEGSDSYLYSILLTLLIGGLFYAFYYYRERQKSKVKEQTIIAGTASAKFDALKNQLDPHFLFNSLNVLSSLIDENPKNAQYFTTSLSKVYRYVLEQKNKELVTVDEELNFAKSYVSLLKMRFEDSIIFQIPEFSKNPENRVVPLSLQLLLENAVKHNTVTSSKPLIIRIYETDDYLVVENNLQVKSTLARKSSGVGLSNIQQRYGLLTNKSVKINKDTNKFSVEIPILTKQISMIQTNTSDYNQSYIRARKHVDNLKEFYYSIVSYCIVIPFLIFINYKTFWGFQWFWFPLFGWGISLIFKAYKIYVDDGFFGRTWEERKIDKYLKDEQARNRERHF